MSNELFTEEAKEYSMRDATNALNSLAGYIGGDELKVVADHVRNSEEKQFFRAKLVELAEIVKTMPRVYGQDGKGDQAIVYLHYFKGGCDWHITETNSPDECFELCDLGMGFPEIGYVSVQELVRCNVELDLHWTPKTLGEVKKERGG